MRRLNIAIFLLLTIVIVGTSMRFGVHAAESPGLLHQPWFKSSNLDLGEDFHDARSQGKILAVLYEQRGCSYCQKMHSENFKNQKIVQFINQNFSVVQLDFRGTREVLDTTGERLEERMLARKHEVNGTPNIVFFNEFGKKVYRMPGYAEPNLFLAVFEYVKERAYEHSSIQDWYKNKGS